MIKVYYLVTQLSHSTCIHADHKLLILLHTNLMVTFNLHYIAKQLYLHIKSTYYLSSISNQRSVDDTLYIMYIYTGQRLSSMLTTLYYLRLSLKKQMHKNEFLFVTIQ